jgi:organic hydroperoxide reductase OsmC/OhrA
VGYAACFETALGMVGRPELVEVGDVSIDGRGSLLPSQERGFKLAVELEVTLPQVQDPEHRRGSLLPHIECAHTRTPPDANIEVTLTVNRHDIG